MESWRRRDVVVNNNQREEKNVRKLSARRFSAPVTSIPHDLQSLIVEMEIYERGYLSIFGFSLSFLGPASLFVPSIMELILRNWLPVTIGHHQVNKSRIIFYAMVSQDSKMTPSIISLCNILEHILASSFSQSL